MKTNRLLIICKFCICLLIVPSFIEAQNAGRKTNTESPVIIRKELNKITDSRHTLEPFYKKLNALSLIRRKTGKASKESTPYVVSVMHIGDSHIQAGFLSVTIMNRLQQRFGSSGRGLIFPLKLARTNEPYDYFIRSESKWNKSLCVQRTHKIPMGLGGLSIETDDKQFTFEIRSSVSNGIDHSFNKMTIFHHDKAPELVVNDPDIGFHNGKKKYPFASTVYLDKQVNKLHLSSTIRSEKDSAIYYGFNLENGKSGILYHAVGLNGAQFRHYASVQHFAQQMTILTPQLFIFSLGTNEAFRGKLMEKYFFAEIDRIIEPIHKANPEASILITTPPDCLGASIKKTQSSNANISYVRKALIRYAIKKGYAYWDLYSILGGDNSAYKLFQAGYLAEDGVHFKKSGYTVLGNLFYDALISNYTDYVQRRSR